MNGRWKMGQLKNGTKKGLGHEVNRRPLGRPRSPNYGWLQPIPSWRKAGPRKPTRLTVVSSSSRPFFCTFSIILSPSIGPQFSLYFSLHRRWRWRIQSHWWISQWREIKKEKKKWRSCQEDWGFTFWWRVKWVLYIHSMVVIAKPYFAFWLPVSAGVDDGKGKCVIGFFVWIYKNMEGCTARKVFDEMSDKKKNSWNGFFCFCGFVDSINGWVLRS